MARSNDHAGVLAMITLEDLIETRPDLIERLEKPLRTRISALERRELIYRLLRKHIAAVDPDSHDGQVLFDEEFMTRLQEVGPPEVVEQLILERIALIQAARRLHLPAPKAGAVIN